MEASETDPGLGPESGQSNPLNWMRRGLGLAAVLGLLIWATGVSVREGNAVLISRFGKPVRVVQDAGLAWKLPWPIDQATVVDQRTRVFETSHTEMLTRDKRNVILLTFATWRISDPLRFVQAVGSTEGAELKLDGLITNAKIGVMGRYDLTALVSTDPATLQVQDIESELLAATAPTALERYGIEITQVAFQRLSLPEENVRYVFKQMRAERDQYAARYKAEGQEQADKVRSETDLEAARIRAQGQEDAAMIKGEAEAEAAAIYAQAHRQDPELYRFLRGLETLDVVVGEQTTVILRTDAEPFSLLESRE